MKFWHVGLVVAGAAVAGGVAVRLAEPPVVPAASVPAQQAQQIAIAPAPAPPPVRWKSVPEEPSEAVSSAPPPVYTEPAAPPPPVKRKPFQAPVTVAKALPAPVIKAPPPVPYQEPPKPARHVTLEEGTRITVRVIPGDASHGVLEQPVIADGLEIGERGAKVALAQQGNQLRLTSFQSADGQRVEVSAEPAAPAGNVVRFRLTGRVTVTERRL